MTRETRAGPGQPGAVDEPLRLAGFTVAIASDRRRHPLATMLERAGARAVGFQVFRTFAQPDEPALKTATLACLERPADEVVVSSAIGLRSWLMAARYWGLADALVDSFRQARLLARDPAAADALRALGLETIWSTTGATTEELLRYLRAQSLAGRRIVVQANDPALEDACAMLRDQQAEVIEVPTFWLTRPLRYDFLRRLTDLVTRHQVDALVLLGAEATEQLLSHAEIEGKRDDLLNALGADVLCAVLSPHTGRRLQQAGLNPLTGALPFIEDLAEAVVQQLPTKAIRVTRGGRTLEIRGHAAVLDSRFIAIQPGPLAVLRALARHAGRPLSMEDLRAEIPGWHAMDDHAIEMAVSRLRRALGETDRVQTVVRRGYRLSL
jgi:uroporphyrinogen-III synthase